MRKMRRKLNIDYPMLIAFVFVVTLCIGYLRIYYPWHSWFEKPEWTSIGRWKVTAYCACKICCGDWADGITASGYKLVGDEKVIAAPVEFKFGTILKVDEYGVGTVLDRCDHIDVYFQSHIEAKYWGIKEVEIWVRNVK